MQHHMNIQDPHKGHEHVSWDPEDPASVAEAKHKFDEAIGQGKRAARVDVQPGELVSEFDPAYVELLLIAPQQGG